VQCVPNVSLTDLGGCAPVKSE